MHKFCCFLVCFFYSVFIPPPPFFFVIQIEAADVIARPHVAMSGSSCNLRYVQTLVPIQNLFRGTTAERTTFTSCFYHMQHTQT